MINDVANSTAFDTTEIIYLQVQFTTLLAYFGEIHVAVEHG